MSSAPPNSSELDLERSARSRRDTLKLSAGTILGLLAGCSTPGRRGSSLQLGLADLTVIKALSQDYFGTLLKAADMGYTRFGFRLADPTGLASGELSPENKARLVTRAGLQIGVVRLGLRNVDYDRQLKQCVDIGASTVALTTALPFISGPRLRETTRAAFEAWLPQLSVLAEKATKLGLTFAYHNHWYDLRPLEGELPLDLIARSTSPEILSFEIDLAWTWYAGVSPVELLARLGGRVVSMHFKDIDRKRGSSPTEHAVAPGAGEMDYRRLLPAIRRVTSAIGYVEVDSPDDGLAAAHAAARLIRETEAGSS